jgi:integrase
MLCSCLEASLSVLLSYALRKSDIKKLTWEEIQPYGSDGVMYVTTRMQKTKDIVHNPISEEALELIGYSPDKRGKVFPDFKDSMTQAPLEKIG